MTSWRAALEVCDGAAIRAYAAAPQRWNRPTRHADGWIETVHQVVGDGLFAGDLHRTRIEVRGDSKAIVRGITAAALRRGEGGAIVTRVSVRAGSMLLYLPGALLPHAGSATTHALRVDVEAGGSALVPSMLLAGRRGHGELGAFASLRLRTVASVGACLAFAEDTMIAPGELDLEGPAGFAGGDVAISILALGAFAPATVAWWEKLPAMADVVWGASQLAHGGVALRGIAATLGAAQAWLEAVESAVR